MENTPGVKTAREENPAPGNDSSTGPALAVSRIDQEQALFESLPEKEIKILIQAFEILAKTSSTWLLNAFKKLLVVRCQELSVSSGHPETYFDYKGASWYERWWIKEEKKREDVNIDQNLPGVIRSWMERLKG